MINFTQQLAKKLSEIRSIRFLLICLMVVAWVLNFSPRSEAKLGDRELAQQNTVTGAQLVLQVENTSQNPSPTLSNPILTATTSARVSTINSIPTWYKQSASLIETNPDVCNFLHVEAEQLINGEWQARNSGVITELEINHDWSLEDLVIVGEAKQEWRYHFSLTNEQLPSEPVECEVSLTYFGVPAGSSSEAGWSDQKTIPYTLLIPAESEEEIEEPEEPDEPEDPVEPEEPEEPNTKIVINEVYYHGGSSTEFVELYNAGNQDVNLKNWKLRDNTSQDVLTTEDLTVKPGEFVVISHEDNDDLEVASGSLRILLSSSVGNGLATSDLLELLDENDEVVDGLNWGSENSIFSPSIPAAVSDKSLARSPLGFDSDIAADWVNNHTPSPGTNPHSHIKVILKQDKNDLNIKFLQATGFDQVKYLITYRRLEAEQIVTESIEGQGAKTANQAEFQLPSIFLGSCSTEQKDCLVHQPIDQLKVVLIYQLAGEILGSSEYQMDWQVVESPEIAQPTEIAE